MVSTYTVRRRLPGSGSHPARAAASILRWFFIVSAATAAAAPLAAQTKSATEPPETSPAVASQAEAVRVLMTGIDAIGGTEALAGMGSVSFVARVSRWVLGQEPTPVPREQPSARNVFRVTLVPEEGMAMEILASPDATESAARVIFGPDDAFMFNAAQQSLQDIEDPDGQPWNWLRRNVTFAPYVLRDAFHRPETLRYLGTTALDGKSVEMITYADERGNQVTLCFEQGSGLLVRMEQLTDHAQWGSVAEAVHFADYRPVDGVSIPHDIRMMVGDRKVSEGTLESTAIGADVSPALFERPDGIAVTPGPIPSGAEAETRTEEVAPGIFQVLHIRPGYNLTYVDLGEEIVAIEPLGGPEASKRMLKEFRSAFPGKRLAGIVVTHHHHDHTDGLVPFLREGIPVYATPGNAEFIRSVANAPRPPGPALPDPDLRLVDEPTSVGSGSNRFELIDVGPNPHAEEILVAYFPERKLLYVADIYGYVPGFTPPPLLLSFAEKLEELGLEVERFVTAHTDPRTWEDYRTMVDAVRAQAAGGGR